jgi:DNA-binding Lrp family transcriptional regulator
MQFSTLLVPEDFVTIEDTTPMISNVISFRNETSRKTNRILSRITIDDSQRPNSRLNKDYYTADDYVLSIKDLHRIDRKILWLLTEQPWSTYSFKALERKLSVHQQTLARALRRLVELDFIAKSPAGYSLNQMNASSILSLIENSTIDLFGEEEIVLEETRKSKKPRKFNQLLQLYIPVKVNVEQLVNHISRKWIGNLRWLGLVKKDTGYRLEWIVRDKYSDGDLFRINVTIVSEYIIVESDAETKSEKIESMSYSNKLVGEIIKGFKRDLTENPDIKETYHQVITDDIKYRVKKGK